MAFTFQHNKVLPNVPDRLSYEYDNITIECFFRMIADQYGDDVLCNAFDEEKGIIENIFVAINGKIIHPSKVLETVISPDSLLAISCMVDGG